MHPTIGNYEQFVDRIEESLYEAGIATSDLAMMDHLCYRVKTDERYQALKQILADTEEFIGEAQVSGRPISTFEFKSPLQAGSWRIPYLELPAPKAGSSYSEGLEHVEFVTIGALSKFQAKYSSLEFKTKGMTKQFNPELGLEIGGVAMKFHEQPLGAVVRIEQALGL